MVPDYVPKLFMELLQILFSFVFSVEDRTWNFTHAGDHFIHWVLFFAQGY